MKIQRQQLIDTAFEAVSKLYQMNPQSTIIKLVIGLPLVDLDSRSKLIRHLYNPASPRFRQFLSPNEYSQKFDSTEASFQGLLDCQKCSIESIFYLFSKFVRVETPVGTVNTAFNVTLKEYAHPTGDRYLFVPDTDAEVKLKTSGIQIIGLHNFQIPQQVNHPEKLKRKVSSTPHVASGSGQMSCILAKISEPLMHQM